MEYWNICYYYLTEHGMEWNGIENGMEQKFRYGRCQNGMEWKISRMEWKTIFHIVNELKPGFG